VTHTDCFCENNCFPEPLSSSGSFGFNTLPFLLRVLEDAIAKKFIINGEAIDDSDCKSD
jgi:hypothetical protein